MSNASERSNKVRTEKCFLTLPIKSSLVTSARTVSVMLRNGLTSEDGLREENLYDNFRS